MRMIWTRSQWFAVVAALATERALVNSFLAPPHVKSGGLKTVGIQNSFWNSHPVHQLRMGADKEGDDDSLQAEPVKDMAEVDSSTAKVNKDEKVMDDNVVSGGEVVTDDTVTGEDESEIAAIDTDETDGIEEAVGGDEITSEEDSASVEVSDAINEMNHEEEEMGEKEASEPGVVASATEESKIVEENTEEQTSSIEGSEGSDTNSGEDDEDIIVEDGDSGLLTDETEDIEISEIVEPTVYQGEASERTSTTVIQALSEDNSKGLDLELIANVAGDIAKDVLSVLRFGAANLLTSSLPENQRQDLLKRMGATSLPPASETAEELKEAAADMAAEKIEEERASIQEEIAMARAEEAQKSEKKWELEKEEILKDMEMAASARVENELKIQKLKLEEETAKSLLEKDQLLQVEKERLEKAIQEERQKFETLEAEKAAEVDSLFAVKTDEEIARNAELEALMEKRKDQQAALESIEEELRVSIENEEEQREQLQSIFEKRQNQQEELKKVEANLRMQVKEIESEKDRYQKLVDGLKAMKEKAQKLQQEEQEARNEDEDDVAEIEEVADGEISGDQSEEEPLHPVLGPVLVDLGYKRIHLVSSGKLGTIPVWNRNRIYRNNRAKSMAMDKFKSMELGFPGVIGLHESSSGKLSIIDGQHRVGMMVTLKETINKKIEKGEAVDNYDDIFGSVLVEVYTEPESSTTTDGDVFAEKVFLEINKAEPVKLIDMPGVASAADRQVITDAVEALQDQFREMFSSSQRCRIPNANVDNLRSMIFGANILKRHKLSSSKKLLDWLLEQNAALGNEYENDETKQKLISKKQWAKASTNNFYLGLESSWLYK